MPVKLGERGFFGREKPFLGHTSPETFLHAKMQIHWDLAPRVIKLSR